MEYKKNPNLEIGRNSSIYFAIGLNVMLFLSWQALEFRTYDKEEVVVMKVLEVESKFEEEIPLLSSISVPPPPPPPAIVTESVEIVEDTEDVEETVFESTETDQNEAVVEHEIVDVGDVHVVEIEEDVEVAFALIEHVPVFPGCEGLSKSATKACFQKKIQTHIAQNFIYPQDALDLNIQGRVSVLFVIDKSGQITGIRSRGPAEILQAEAERIISTLPKMKAGTQRGKPVKVGYAVPIFFKMESSK